MSITTQLTFAITIGGTLSPEDCKGALLVINKENQKRTAAAQEAVAGTEDEPDLSGLLPAETPEEITASLQAVLEGMLPGMMASYNTQAAQMAVKAREEELLDAVAKSTPQQVEAAMAALTNGGG